MPKWKIRLEGDKHILSRLAETFRRPDFSIGRTGEWFCVTSEVVDALGSAQEAEQYVRQQLPFLNYCASLTDRRCKPVTVHSVLDADGRAAYFVTLGGTLTLSDCLTVAGGTGERPPTAHETLMEPDVASSALAMQHTDHALQQALRLWNAYVSEQPHPEPWVALRRLLETLEDDLPQNVHRMGWTSSQLRTRFNDSANKRAASGDKAVHATVRDKPRHGVMAVHEAEQWVGDLIAQYILWKLDTRGSETSAPEAR